MISHVDENNTNEIEIHEFINLLGNADDSSSSADVAGDGGGGGGSLDGLIEAIGKSLAFNINDISSKYESEGHMRQFKQHKRMLTLSGRRSLLHENNFISNKSIIHSPTAHEMLHELNGSPPSSLGTASSSPSYFKSRHFNVGTLLPSPSLRIGSGKNGGVSLSSSGVNGGGGRDSGNSELSPDVVAIGRQGIRGEVSPMNSAISSQSNSYNVNTKADYWNRHSSTASSASSFVNAKKEPCEELDKIAKYLDQNFDRVRHNLRGGRGGGVYILHFIYIFHFCEVVLCLNAMKINCFDKCCYFVFDCKPGANILLSIIFLASFILFYQLLLLC